MSVSVILASSSPSRRRVLLQAGVNPNVSVSHVDEPAALEAAAARFGGRVADLDAKQRVEILARAKARAVASYYRSVAQVAADAHGEQVTAYPLQAPQVTDAGAGGVQSDETQTGSQSRFAGAKPPVADARFRPADVKHSSDGTSDIDRTVTQDFSGLAVPTRTEPLDEAMAGLHGFESSSHGPLIIGCDSMFLFGGETFGKPHTPQVARERLTAMRGKSGELWTGHCVIDFATGRELTEASHARVRFADYTDEQVEAYVSTGEPLEVAGCFTLEGLGGPFIESVEGDPSGVLGISLPLLRRLAGKLGIDWTRLWNWQNTSAVQPGFGSRPQAQDSDIELRVAAATSPQGRIRQPGDGWVECVCGSRHWGRHGAAGILLARRDERTGEVTDIVMQHRAQWSAEGGTWGIPGGAITAGETPIEGALRESYEEANITPDDIEVVGTHREEHGPWAYTTVIAFEKPGHRVDPHPNDDESLKIGWVPVSNVAGLKLLTAFRTDWPGFTERLDRLAREYKGK